MTKENTSDRYKSLQTRRSFLQKGGIAVTSLTAGFTMEATAHEAVRTTYTICDGTPDETEVFVTDTQNGGPTAVVIGGVHGDEPAGYQAAGGIKTWSIDRGTLITIPQSNPVAIQRQSHSNDRGNLNRKFPPGETATTPLARSIWGVIASYNPDIVISLHSSRGIYQEDAGPDGVGQAIYPTTANGAREDATATWEYMNRYHLDDSFPNYYQFKGGNTIDGTRPLLIHKVDSDLDVPGFIVEVTRYETSVSTRRNWELNIVRHLLRCNGIDRTFEN